MAMEEPPQSGPTEAMSETVSVSVTDPPKKMCPECDQATLIKTDPSHWYCSECETQFLIQKEI